MSDNTNPLKNPDIPSVAMTFASKDFIFDILIEDK